MSGIRHIGIVGEGKMGTNIFHYISGFDLQLSWLCSDAADTGKLLRTFQKKIKRSQDAGILTEARYNFLLDTTTISTDLADLVNCDLVIEAIPEELSMKQTLFRALDSVVKAGCILASNSSSILPSGLVPSENRKDRTIGLHFFYPVSLKNIVEFVFTDETSESCKSAISSFLRSIERHYLPMNEESAFILNRIYLEVQVEAFHIVKEGKCTYRQMDELVKESFSPAGIFEFFDSVGLDVMLASIRNYTAHHPEREKFSALINSLEELVKEGKLGQKSGQGFYEYNASEEPDHEQPANPLSVEEINARLNDALGSAIDYYAVLSGLPAQEITSAMKEYMG